jgi:hypothetical protein
MALHSSTAVHIDPATPIKGRSVAGFQLIQIGDNDNLVNLIFADDDSLETLDRLIEAAQEARSQKLADLARPPAATETEAELAAEREPAL